MTKEKMIFKADTPIKRIGLILLALYALYVLGFAVYWNIAEEPFAYHTNETVYSIPEGRIIVPSMPPSEEGIKWARNAADNAWYKIDAKCNDKAKQDQDKEVKFDPSTAKEITDPDKYFTDAEPIALFNKNGKFIFAHKCIVSELLDTENYRWETSFEDFFEEFIEFWQPFLIFITGMLFIFSIPDKIIYRIKKIFIWVKTGHWERNPKDRFNLSPQLKKYIYGSGVIICWLTTEVLIRNSGIMLGAIPYTAIMMFWLWMFCRAIGRTFWGFKKIETDKEYLQREKKSLMKKYSITKNKDGNYEYNNQNYESYDEALNAARYGAE